MVAEWPSVWLLPDRAADRAHLDEWCKEVGPPVVRHSDRTAAAADRITVVSWNVHVGAGEVSALVDALHSGQLTGEPTSQFVLLLQEAFRSGPEVPASIASERALPEPIEAPAPGHDIAAIARAFDLSLFYVPSMRNSRAQEDRGNAVLATLPLSSLRVVELPFEKQRRAVVVATIAGISIAGSSWQLTVASAHFDTSAALTRGGPGASRLRQARTLTAALEELRGPVAIGGDLNTWWGDDEPAVRELHEHFPDAAPLAARETWHGPLGAGGKLDHLFVRAGCEKLVVRRGADRFGSDHFPIAVTVPVNGC